MPGVTIESVVCSDGIGAVIIDQGYQEVESVFPNLGTPIFRNRYKSVP